MKKERNTQMGIPLHVTLALVPVTDRQVFGNRWFKNDQILRYGEQERFSILCRTTAGSGTTVTIGD